LTLHLQCLCRRVEVRW